MTSNSDSLAALKNMKDAIKEIELHLGNSESPRLLEMAAMELDRLWTMECREELRRGINTLRLEKQKMVVNEVLKDFSKVYSVIPAINRTRFKERLYRMLNLNVLRRLPEIAEAMALIPIDLMTSPNRAAMTAALVRTLAPLPRPVFEWP